MKTVIKMEKLTKVWITKYALTKGIFSAMAETNDRRAYIPRDHITGVYSRVFGCNDYHFSKELAIERAEEMRVKKIQSLEKQIVKIESLKFK